MNRTNCVICDGINIPKIYEFKHYPLCRHSIKPIETDKYADLEFGQCNDCACLQLLTLQDPDLLYKENNNQTFVTPNWMEHHTQFANFILNNIDAGSKITEIGGKTGILARKIQSVTPVDYTIIDLCDMSVDISGVTFKNENAENATYTSNDTIIMSHVFEHLYKPREFLRRLYKSKVKDIFISIPNMLSLLKKNVLLLINVEHTFYCDIDFCKALFSSIGYSYKNSFLYKDHSLFFHFRLDIPVNIEWTTISPLRQELGNYFQSIEQVYKSIHTDNKIYIAPAGYYGQMMYYLLSYLQNKVIGFLDNDPLKSGQRVYGIPLYVYHPSILTNIDSPFVLLSSSLYSDEIVKDMLKYNHTIKFIQI